MVAASANCGQDPHWRYIQCGSAVLVMFTAWMCKCEKDSASDVEDTERTRFCPPRTDGRTGQIDKVKPVYPPFNFVRWIQCNCRACRTILIATRFRVAVICPIIQVPHCIRVFFYLFDLCLLITFFNFIMNYVPIVTFWIFTYHYVLFYMKLLNYLFFSMFGSVLESCELTGVCLLLPWLIK